MSPRRTIVSKLSSFLAAAGLAAGAVVGTVLGGPVFWLVVVAALGLRARSA